MNTHKLVSFVSKADTIFLQNLERRKRKEGREYRQAAVSGVVVLVEGK